MADAAREPVLTTPWFRFYSDFDFNLCDAVLAAATARRKGEPDPLHGECFSGLVQEERSSWEAAVGYYAETVAGTSDFSREPGLAAISVSNAFTSPRGAGKSRCSAWSTSQAAKRSRSSSRANRQ